MGLLVNVDVPDLVRAVAFYTQAFGLTVSRRFGAGAAELRGWPVDLYLLEKPEGGEGAGGEPRRYARHWTPVHLDVTVDDADAALARALGAGADAGRADARILLGAHRHHRRPVRQRPLPAAVPRPRL